MRRMAGAKLSVGAFTTCSASGTEHPTRQFCKAETFPDCRRCGMAVVFEFVESVSESSQTVTLSRHRRLDLCPRIGHPAGLKGRLR